VVAGLEVHQEDRDVFEALRRLTQEINGQDGDTDGVAAAGEKRRFSLRLCERKKCLAPCLNTILRI